MNTVKGGVCAAKGFLANGVLAGIKKTATKPDLALIYSEKTCNSAAVYTQNLVKGAPIAVTKKNIESGEIKALVCNSGNANTCNADGEEKALKMCSLVADKLKINKEDVIVASTGVIGQVLPIEPIENAMEGLVAGLKKDGNNLAATAIMTTDTYDKQCAVSVEIGGKTVTIGGMAKGSGMIHPNMATMLCFVTTDCAISADLLQKAVKSAADDSFNMVSVDGDTSTNDMLTVMANGMAENTFIDCENGDYELFLTALTLVCTKLSKLMARDGEGATKLIICDTQNACDKEVAKKVAKSVICSSLLKAAMFGEDANWGRVLCAIGYSGAVLDVTKIDVSFKSSGGTLEVCKNGAGIDFSEELGKEVLKEEEITIIVNLNDGCENATAFGCDLTYDYVKINGDYRT